MTDSRYSAWRFAFRGVTDTGAPVGLVISPRGAIETVDEADSVRQAILLLVCTRPGERVMRADYGCHLFRLTFAPNDDTTAGLAIHYVRQAIERWERRIHVLQITADRNRDHESRIDVQLQYRLRTRLGTERLTLAIDLRTGRVR